MDKQHPGDSPQITEIIDQRRPQTSWVKYVSFAVVGVAAVLCATYLANKFTPEELAKAGEKSADKVADLGAKFAHYCERVLSEDKTTSTTVSVGNTLMAKDGPLIVASRDMLLQFMDVNKRLGSTSTAEVKVPSKPYYYVPLLGANWSIETSVKGEQHLCVVHAPELRVLTPVGLDPAKIEIKVDTGWLRFNAKDMKDAAMAEIAQRLAEHAQTESPSARDEARKTIINFVKIWLVDSKLWGDGGMNSIQVLFPGEKAQDVGQMSTGRLD